MDAENKACAHNEMIRTGNPLHAWKCADCGYVYRSVEWIKVTDRMPEPEVPVFAIYQAERIIRGKKDLVPIGVRACWIPRYTREEDGSEYQWDCDYDEKKDVYFWPQGWYEWNEVEEVHFLLPNTVTHWMPIPELPKEDDKGGAL